MFTSSIIVLLFGFLVRTTKSMAPYTMNMYKTDQQMFEEEDQNCLYHYKYNSIEDSNIQTHHLYSYCIRNNNVSAYNLREMWNINSSPISFSELRAYKITSHQLFLWSAPIDLIENYQIYLINSSETAFTLGSQRFYNCTWPLFGSFCQFKFDILHRSFADLINNALSSLDGKPENPLKRSLPCYTGIQCDYIYSFPLCLDWREVCDGKIHCLNEAKDEQNCFELEMNQCSNDNEYRCHDGTQCIPHAFWNDDATSPDCRDRSDEVLHNSVDCYVNSSVSCEEHTCRPGRITFTCGDGSCDDFQDCFNGRSEQLDAVLKRKSSEASFDDTCLSMIGCFINSYWHEDCICTQWNTCNILIQQLCTPKFSYPSYPIALGHIYFVYTNTQLYSAESFRFTLPTYICYDEKLCPIFKSSFQSLHSTIISFDNTFLHCHNQSNLPLSNKDRNMTWYHFQRAVETFYTANCITYGQMHANITENCHLHSQLYQCTHSSKCISKHRLLDAIQDCPLGDDENYEESCSLTNKNYRFQCVVNKTVKCVSPILFNDKEYDCLTKKQTYNDIINHTTPAYAPISFQTLCDGFEERFPLIIDGQSIGTDETHCNDSIWSCNNTYTHCDGYWNCANGLDELGCPSVFDDNSGKSRCKANQHICLTDIATTRCLNLSQANDGKVDCLGAFDERSICRQASNLPGKRYLCPVTYKCIDITTLCSDSYGCHGSNDGKICDILRPVVSEINCLFQLFTDQILNCDSE